MQGFFFFVPFVTNFAGPYDQVLPLEPQPKGLRLSRKLLSGTAGQNEGGISYPSATYLSATSACSTAPIRELRTSPFLWGGQGRSRLGK